RLRSIFRSLGKTANLAGGVVRPHRNGLAHGKPPQFAILNHAAIDSGIPRESATQRLGITPFPITDERARSNEIGPILVPEQRLVSAYDLCYGPHSCHCCQLV